MKLEQSIIDYQRELFKQSEAIKLAAKSSKFKQVDITGILRKVEADLLSGKEYSTINEPDIDKLDFIISTLDSLGFRSGVGFGFVDVYTNNIAEPKFWDKYGHWVQGLIITLLFLAFMGAIVYFIR